jgi:hypothetical protein
MSVLLKKGAKMADHYQSEQEIHAVVAGFEQCTTAKDGFPHLSHLTVAAYYLSQSTPEEAFQKMRYGLLRFLDHHGVGLTKYKDELTWAWIEQVQSVVKQIDSGASLVAVTNTVLDRLGTIRITLEDQGDGSDLAIR